MKKTLWMFAIALLSTPFLIGCNTIDGAGKDIERGGEKIQEQAR